MWLKAPEQLDPPRMSIDPQVLKGLYGICVLGKKSIVTFISGLHF